MENPATAAKRAEHQSSRCSDHDTIIMYSYARLWWVEVANTVGCSLIADVDENIKRGGFLQRHFCEKPI